MAWNGCCPQFLCALPSGATHRLGDLQRTCGFPTSTEVSLSQSLLLLLKARSSLNAEEMREQVSPASPVSPNRCIAPWVPELVPPSCVCLSAPPRDTAWRLPPTQHCSPTTPRLFFSPGTCTCPEPTATIVLDLRACLTSDLYKGGVAGTAGYSRQPFTHRCLGSVDKHVRGYSLSSWDAWEPQGQSW